MQLNQATDYAFRLVLNLSLLSEGEIAKGSTISEQENIPPRFLLKIVRYLTKAGLVKSYRGVDGGFALARPPEEITLLDVILAMEGKVAIHRCLENGDACTKHCTQVCPIHQKLAGIQSMITESLAGSDFKSLSDKYVNGRGNNG